MHCSACGTIIDKSVRKCPNCGASLSLMRIFFHHLLKLDEYLVSICLSVMLIAVLLQIVLRNFFQSGITGGDALVRHMVLWVAFLGASLAAKDSTHIRIDIAEKILPERVKPFVEFIVILFSIYICGILIYASYHFVQMEFESQSKIAFLDIPIWVLEFIIPLGYFLIALRFGINGYKQFMRGIGK